MARLAQGVKDKRVLRLIGAFLRAGVLEDDLVSPLTEGTPQGGPLSPLLSNIVLDELDRELEFRGHRFVRYADDCNIYVGSERAGQRVMASVSRFITQKLKLRVNQRKSAVDRPSQRKFLGFSFTNETRPRRRIAPESLKRLHLRVRKLTRRARGVSLATVVMELASYLKGWRQYYGYCETPGSSPGRKAGSADVFEASSGRNGRPDNAEKSGCGPWACQQRTRRARLGAAGALGPTAVTSRSNKHSPTATSPNWVYLHWYLNEASQTPPTQPNRRVRDPYARWCGRGGP